MNSFLTAFIAGLIPAAILSYPIYRGLLALKARQTVSQHVAEHAHKQGTPTMGGLMILAGLIPAVIYLMATGILGVPKESGITNIPTHGVLVLIVGYALIGFVDDFVIPRLMKGKRGLGWTQKLVMQIGLAALAVFMLAPGDGLYAAFAIFSILFFSNAFNFTDGLDWLASTVLVALAGGAAYLAFRVDAPGVAYLFVSLIGATLPFMAFNRPPAKIFMGDVGSMPIGGLLGLGFAAIFAPKVAPAIGAVPFHLAKGGDDYGWVWPTYSARSDMVFLGLLLMSFVMIAELVPVPLQIASVKIRKKRLFPMTPIHHAFQKAGWKETKIVAMFFAFQVVCSLLGLAIALSGATH